MRARASAENFRQRVVAVIEALEPAEVLSYGEVAAAAGFPGAARAVGAVLRRGADLPWWRVVMADGRLAPGKEAEQAQLLRAEGVSVRGGRVSGMGPASAVRAPGEARGGPVARRRGASS